MKISASLLMATGGRFFNRVLFMPLWPGHEFLSFCMVLESTCGVIMVSVCSVLSLFVSVCVKGCVLSVLCLRNAVTVCLLPSGSSYSVSSVKMPSQ